jgi:hypothetical protein
MGLPHVTSAQNNAIVTLHLLYVFQQDCNMIFLTERESSFINTGNFRDFLRLKQKRFSVWKFWHYKDGPLLVFST